MRKASDFIEGEMFVVQRCDFYAEIFGILESLL